MAPQKEETTATINTNFGPQGSKKRPNPRNKEQQKRGGHFRVWQKLYAKDRRAAATHILNNTTPISVKEAPEPLKVEKAYNSIFGSESPPDATQATRINYGLDSSYNPITRKDIQDALRTSRPSAPGVDGVTLQGLRKVPIHLIEVLYNTMLYMKKIPPGLKQCRTTLIPKKGNLRDIDNWRPITVPSLVMRLFNKILVSRLNKLTINLAQKGFRRIDGCLANALLLQSVIKEYRRKAAPYHIVTLDLRKAFDTVSTHSIPRALRRIGVHPGTLNHRGHVPGMLHNSSL